MYVHVSLLNHCYKVYYFIQKVVMLLVITNKFDCILSNYIICVPCMAYELT